jgi:RHS repeat-associated protein
MQVNGLPPITYQHNANRRLTQVVQSTQTAALVYDASNRRTRLELPNGVVVTYSYDTASRLIAQTFTGPGGPLGDLTYTYDATGRRVGTGGTFARTLLPGSVPSSDYDSANEQLAFRPVTQTFDPNGNLLTKTDGSGTNTYTWDARNRLVAINGASISATFAYDAFNRRIAKTINGQTTTFHYDRLDIVRELGGAGEAGYLRTLAIDETLARTDASGMVAYLSDTLGSTVALADASGNPSTGYAYAPFGLGELSGRVILNPFQFTGREEDSTGLYYYRARYYDPSRGRFVSEDPLLFRGDSTNVYVYVRNSPLNGADPLGLVYIDPPGGTTIGSPEDAPIGPPFLNWSDPCRLNAVERVLYSTQGKVATAAEQLKDPLREVADKTGKSADKVLEELGKVPPTESWGDPRVNFWMNVAQIAREVWIRVNRARTRPGR